MTDCWVIIQIISADCCLAPLLFQLLLALSLTMTTADKQHQQQLVVGGQFPLLPALIDVATTEAELA